MNNFESERAAKAARFRQLAEKHANIAIGRHFAARERLGLIPLGQPILVGHHSEKRHRRDLKQIFFPEIPPKGIRRELKRTGFTVPDCRVFHFPRLHTALQIWL